MVLNEDLIYVYCYNVYIAQRIENKQVVDSEPTEELMGNEIIKRDFERKVPNQEPRQVDFSSDTNHLVNHSWTTSLVPITIKHNRWLPLRWSHT
ncbi:hypothetical protein [Parasitella parasitica]|uniref:Uncharacterized protein n=1 Tax=Parasitella parasitica TaxID=35722 RepID=A0A0B7NHI8_9FUNG|nr:hypothetical protein [Parasitella parasitica]